MLLLKLLCCALLFVASVSAATVQRTKPTLKPASHPLSVAYSSKQISAELLDCTTSNPLRRVICSVLQTKLNHSLTQAAIRIDQHAFLFSYDDSTSQRIDTGHSCSVTAQLRTKRASARFARSTELDFDHGTILSEPLVLSVKVPVMLEAQADIKQSFGVKVFGRCRRLGSDSFTVRASLSTNANVVIALTLNAGFHTRASGEYVVSVKPVVAVMFDLERTDLHFEVSGLSIVTSLAGPLLGFISSLTDGVKDLFDGRGVKSIVDNLQESVPFDLGLPLFSRLESLPRPASDLVYDLLSDVGEREIEKRAKGYESDLEELLNAKIRDAIGADSNGERQFVIRRNVLNLFGTASIDDILL